MTQVSLKAQFDAISVDIYQINIQIQELKKQGNQAQLITAPQARKFQKQQDIVNLKIRRELRRVDIRWVSSHGGGSSWAIGKSHPGA